MTTFLYQSKPFFVFWRYGHGFCYRLKDQVQVFLQQVTFKLRPLQKKFFWNTPNLRTIYITGVFQKRVVTWLDWILLDPKFLSIDDFSINFRVNKGNTHDVVSVHPDNDKKLLVGFFPIRHSNDAILCTKPHMQNGTNDKLLCLKSLKIARRWTHKARALSKNSFSEKYAIISSEIPEACAIFKRSILIDLFDPRFE